VISGRALSGVLPASLPAVLGASIISAIGAWSLLAALVPSRSLTKSLERRSGGLIGGRHLPSLRYAGGQGLALREGLVLGAAVSLNKQSRSRHRHGHRALPRLLGERGELREQLIVPLRPSRRRSLKSSGS
jgi:hypothetical protein